MRFRLAVLSTLLLGTAACNVDPTAAGPEATTSAATSPSGDPFAAHDPAPGQASSIASPDPQARPIMQLQVVLDRLGFTPGVVDGKQGASTRNAILGFQEANNLDPSGALDTATKQALAKWQNVTATRVVTIPAEFAAGPFAPLPKDPAEQAKLPALGYASLAEKLAERFHTTPETLKALNPDMAPAPAQVPTAEPSDDATPSLSPPVFRAGQSIRVPNVGGDVIEPGAVKDALWLQTLVSLGVGSAQPKADRIVVSKSKGYLKVYDKAGKLIGMYTATMGSAHDPLPIGNWKVLGVSRNPSFHYNPALFWDASSTDTKQKLPAGPNGPVGVVWIDLNKPHYGIHGTPQPQTIGRAESHGCVRLTNWDAARMAQMVSPGTKVVFER